jgi:hypothetical protein
VRLTGEERRHRTLLPSSGLRVTQRRVHDRTMLLSAMVSLLVGLSAAATAADAAGATAGSPLAPVTSLAIVYRNLSLNATASIIARVVVRKSGCTMVEPPASHLTLTLEIDPTLGPEAYSATFDGNRSATIRGGDRMGATFGAGAFLRAAQFSPAGLVPPQPTPPPPPPPPSPPPVPISSEWWAGEANRSYGALRCSLLSCEPSC